MTENEETKKMTENLVRLIRENGNHLATGFTGTPYLLFALSDHGRADIAYQLLLQDTCPSWLYEVKADGTTIWERWDALRPDGTVNISQLTGTVNEAESDGGMVSFNHYANGAVGDWLYRKCLGIEPITGGYKTFKMKPILGGGITWAKGNVKTPYGMIQAEWHIKQDNIFAVNLRVPVSSKCILMLPNGEEYELESGEYQINCKI